MDVILVSVIFSFIFYFSQINLFEGHIGPDRPGKLITFLCLLYTCTCLDGDRVFSADLGILYKSSARYSGMWIHW